MIVNSIQTSSGISKEKLVSSKSVLEPLSNNLTRSFDPKSMINLQSDKELFKSMKVVNKIDNERAYKNINNPKSKLKKIVMKQNKNTLKPVSKV